MLAHLFTAVDRTGIMPRDSTKAIIIPISKKSEISSPANYRPVRSLSVIGKLYAEDLLNNLVKWINDKAILGCEQN